MDRMRIGLLVALILLTGCIRPPVTEIRSPEVAIAEITVEEPGAEERRLRIDLRLHNPNDFDIAVKQLRVRLEVEELTFGEGATTPDLVLPAQGEAVVPVTVALDINDVIIGLLDVGADQKLIYRLTAEAEPVAEDGRIVQFESSGGLALPNVPELRELAS